MIMASFNHVCIFIKLKWVPFLNESQRFRFSFVYKQYSKQMINFMLKNNRSNSFQLQGYFLSVLVEKSHFNMFGPFDIASYSWDR